MEVKIYHKATSSEVNVTGAQLLVRGKLQIYVCHDGSLEVYVNGKDIKERLGINVSSMWLDFGDAALVVEKNPGYETEARPKDFGFRKTEAIIDKSALTSSYESAVDAFNLTGELPF